MTVTELLHALQHVNSILTGEIRVLKNKAIIAGSSEVLLHDNTFNNKQKSKY